MLSASNGWSRVPADLSGSKTCTLDLENFRASPTSYSLFIFLFVLFENISELTSAEREKEKYRTSVDIFWEKRGLLSRFPCQRLVIGKRERRGARQPWTTGNVEMEHDIPFENSNRENGPTFLDFPLFLGIFQWDEPIKRCSMYALIN